ncbi:MAG: hypothetical protein R2852_02895 [Bacteroidia bacterium]
MIQTNFIKNALLLICITSIAITACKTEEPKPDQAPENENELITTVQLEFEDSVTQLKSYAVFKDLDGDGGNNPSHFDTIYLDSQRTYFTRILLLDESKTPADTISNEVLEEANDHLFVFKADGLNLNVQILDKDQNNLPLGLYSRWKTGSSGMGKVNVTLKHQPGLKDGTAAPGESDISLDFETQIR